MAAVGIDRVSRAVGYTIQTANFSNTTPNLPQRVAIFGEANTDNQGTLDTTPVQLTSAKQAGDLYGYGSPIYGIARILFPPLSGNGIGGIPVWVYPQEEAGSATSKIVDVTPSGVATGNGTHTLVIAGRAGLDGDSYDINIETGDTATEVSAKMVDVVSSVLGCPVTSGTDTYKATLETKWAGLTANDLQVSVNTNGNDLGLSYAVTVDQTGSGTPSISDALSALGNAWTTLVINSYGTVSSVVTALETFNGVPSNTTPTGRYDGLVFKPFVALTGSVADEDTTFTDSKKDQCTIAICPAPLSKGFPFEAAANMALLLAPLQQNTPAGNISGQTYVDMPTPIDIGTMAVYNNRDLYAKKGNSTVDLVDGKYKIMDFVTTWHPTGESEPQYRNVRSLNQDFNIAFKHKLLVETSVVGRIIVNDNDIVTAPNTIKPKEFKGLLIDLADELGKQALIADVPFMKASIQVSISATNPNRLEDSFSYKRSGTANIVSTTATAGFNFGS